MEHLVNDLLYCRLQAWTFPAGIEARWLGEGILQLLPTAPWRQATILSAGVHGNETAPIELLLQLTHDLSQGRQPLTQALLIVFGNLPAIRAARRYLHNDLNRLFGGRHLAVTPGNESRRAFALEQAVQAFYRAADAADKKRQREGEPGEDQADNRVDHRKEDFVEHQRGGGAIEKIIEPFDGAACQARDQYLLVFLQNGCSVVLWIAHYETFSRHGR